MVHRPTGRQAEQVAKVRSYEGVPATAEMMQGVREAMERVPQSSPAVEAVEVEVEDEDEEQKTRRATLLEQFMAERETLVAGMLERWRQLFNAGLFPGSLLAPRTCYTFRVLRDYEVHAVASKKNAKDYCKGIAQLGNRSFPNDNPVFYANFLTVARVWSRVRIEMWSGQAHGIDRIFPRRPQGNLVTYCPACPEADVNLEEGYEKAPDNLAHVYGSRKTQDGNFQIGHYARNHDKRDVSLYEGRGYFVHHEVEREYLRTVPQLQKRDGKERRGTRGQGEELGEVVEKATCGYLHALENHDKIKFHGMDISGVIGVLCDHVFVWSFVDMQFGERFANTDLGLAAALFQRPFDKGKVPSQTLSYDCQCKNCRHLLERMTVAFPNLAYLLEDARFTIPAVHVRNHLDMCMWLFAAAYKECAGRFHGETAEQIWAEFNLLGAAVRQMSPGHRQDWLIVNATAWNMRKLTNIGAQLEKDCREAVEEYTQKREDLVSLYKVHERRMEEWMAMDRSPQVDPTDKRRVRSVYTHDNDKSMSYEQLMDRMLLSKERIACGNWWIEETRLGRWFREALLIEDEEADLRRRRKALQEFERSKDAKMRAEVKKKEEELAWRYRLLLEHQRELMPRVFERVMDLGQGGKNCDARVVYLPSAIAHGVRQELELSDVADKEVECRKQLAVSCILKVREVVRNLSALTDFKIAHDRGQQQNTRSQGQIQSYRRIRDALIEDYNRHRGALLSLGYIAEGSHDFRALSLSDTARKSTTSKRAIGDSRRRDGDLWIMGSGSMGVTKRVGGDGDGEGGAKTTSATLCDPSSSSSWTGMKSFGTQQSRRKSSPKKNGAGRANAREEAKVAMKKDMKTRGVRGDGDGWIWSKAIEGQTEDKWAEIQDRVKFFRDEAERDRWLEQVEIKHAEFHRVLRTFKAYSVGWTKLSQSAQSPGHRAYAHREGHKFAKLWEDASGAFARVGIPMLRVIPENSTLVEQIVLFRAQEERLYPAVQATRPPFVDPTRNIKAHSALDPEDSEDEGETASATTQETTSLGGALGLR